MTRQRATLAIATSHPALPNSLGIAIGALLLLSGCSAESAPAPPFERLAPEGLAQSQALWNYSQVVVTSPGARIVEVAGTTGDDEHGNIVAPDDFAGQVERTFANVGTSLSAAGATGHDVVRVRLYVVNLDGEKHWPVINAQMRKHFGEQGPAATLVGVQALATPDILFEMDATAAIGARVSTSKPAIRKSGSHIPSNREQR
jgi:enamine deaminase RidA (YjgF/YER057c/UK114 family)